MTQRLGHAVGQNALCITNGSHNAWHHIIEHIERHWCPTIESKALLAKK